MAKSNPRRSNGYRRDQLLLRVRTRDTHCWWCKKPVDKGLPPRLDGSPEVHELLAVSRGGSATDPNNCVLTHRSCNQWIGNRTPAELAALTAKRQPVRTGFAW